MTTVTTVIKSVKDIKKYRLMNLLRVHTFQIHKQLHPQQNESVPAFILGQAIPNLALVELGENPEEVYRPALIGINNHYIRHGVINDHNFPACVKKESRNYQQALNITCYESFYRSGRLPEIEDINSFTVENIEIMIDRLKTFLKRQKDIVKTAGEFPGAYTDKIWIGEYDILTNNAIIDIKVSKYDVSEKDVLQVIVYYLMGQQSLDKELFRNIEYLILFNPRLNKVSYVEVKDLNESLINQISREVIGYEDFC